MLILATVLVAWSLGGAVVGVPNVLRFQASPELQRFVERMSSAEGFDFKELRTFPRTLETSEEMQRVAHGLKRQLLRFAVSALLVLVLFILAGCFYLAVPWFYRQRYSPQRLTDQENPKVLADLRHHAARAGLDPMPVFCWKPGFLDGLAFGQRGKQMLAISGQPRRLERSWNDLHRAVALHEMGHFVNRDVRTREIARALWLALIVVAGLSIFLFILSLLFVVDRNEAFDGFAPFILKILGVIGITWTLWANLVRTREFYADWRVLAWGYGEALARRLTLATPVTSQRFAVLRLHPSNEARRRILSNPRSLFLVSSSLAFLTGALLGILLGSVTTLMIDFLAFLIYIGTDPLVIAIGGFYILVTIILLVIIFGLGILFTFGYGIFGALGVQVLRSALAGLDKHSAADRGYLGLLRPAIIFVIGFEAGLLLTPLTIFGWEAGSTMVFWFLGAVFLVWIWLVQVRTMGRLVLGACSRGSTIRRVELLLRWMAALQLAALFLPAILGRLAIYAANDSNQLTDLAGGFIPANIPMVFAAGCLVLLAVGLGLSALTSLATLATVFVWLGLRKPSCTACGQRVNDWRFVGVPCDHCGEDLAPWLYLRPLSKGRAA